jgi:hypothetical protein
MLAKNGGFTFASGGELKADLMREASTFCRSRGQQLMPTNFHSVDSGIAKYGNAEIEFRCLDRGDSELGRPRFRKSPDLVIETRQGNAD